MTIFSLTQLANQLKSDKGNEYKCAHHYTLHYEKIFTDKIFSDEFSLLEIGLNRDDCNDLPSLKMYRQYLPKAKLYGFDIRHEFAAFNSMDFAITIGDQSSVADLRKLKNHSYEIIIDDGSHASSHQQISLRELWPTVASGGYYVIEDLHWQPFQEDCAKTVDLARSWMEGEMVLGSYLSHSWMSQFEKEIESIQLLPSASKLYSSELASQAFLVLKKK